MPTKPDGEPRTMIEICDIRKEFLVNNSGARSLKTMILWWHRRKLQHHPVLKGVTFDVKQGECVAVIGRNGAGKSTLLSLLARVYKPTSGSMKIHGRVAPLLELGAGFHPDLTAYENIGFNAIILGLTRAQVRERIDKIIDFSELRSQIHAPTRTYSSGMLARLGFSVAVHVDAEVLIVDEVLSVGDYEFEQKCVRTIEEFRNSGGAVLFVSHRMDTIRAIADRCVWLHKGVVRKIGTPDEVIPEYESTPLETDEKR